MVYLQHQVSQHYFCLTPFSLPCIRQSLSAFLFCTDTHFLSMPDCLSASLPPYALLLIQIFLVACQFTSVRVFGYHSVLLIVCPRTQCNTPAQTSSLQQQSPMISLELLLNKLNSIECLSLHMFMHTFTAKLAASSHEA